MPHRETEQINNTFETRWEVNIITLLYPDSRDPLLKILETTMSEVTNKLSAGG